MVYHANKEQTMYEQILQAACTCVFFTAAVSKKIEISLILIYIYIYIYIMSTHKHSILSLISLSPHYVLNS